MKSRPVRILLVDDDSVDRMACRRALAADPSYAFTIIEAETGAEGLAVIRGERLDGVILDYGLPDQTGLEFLADLLDSQPLAQCAPPVMVLTGHDNAAIAAELMRRGASEYLAKDIEQDYVKLLPSVLHRMLRTRELTDAKHQLEARYRLLVEQVPAITYIYPLSGDPGGRYVSPQIRMLGLSPQQWVADPDLPLPLVHPSDQPRVRGLLARSLEGGAPLRADYRVLTRDGTQLWIRNHADVVRDSSHRPLLLQGVMFDITQSKDAEQSLRESREALRSLSAHQDRIKEKERKRIAQEIHDELGGMLTGIKAYVSVSIERAERAGLPVDALLQDAVRLADDAMAAVRRVIADLRPSVLDQLGLWEAIEWYAGQIEARSNLHYQCLISPQAQSTELDSDVATMLFRIVQEALTNVIRHAEASSVTIEADSNGRILEVEVSDDGKGMKTPAGSGRDSWGLFGMRERARHLGGDLIILSEEQRGTSVKVRIPLERA